MDRDTEDHLFEAAATALPRIAKALERIALQMEAVTDEGNYGFKAVVERLDGLGQAVLR